MNGDINSRIAELLPGLKVKDNAAWNELWGMVGDRLVKFADSRMPGDGHDLAQEAIKNVCRQIDERPKLTIGYLYGAVAFVILGCVRKNTLPVVSMSQQPQHCDGESMMEFQADTLAPDESAIRNELERDLHRMLNELPEKHSEVLILYYFDSLTHKQIAERIREKEDRVRKRLGRARFLLANKLRDG